MKHEEFLNSIKSTNPPDVSLYLKALWHDKKNEWDKAHSIAQDIHDPYGSWIHAYLHRVEGDEWNAQYWYSKANRRMPGIALAEEWEQLVNYFLDQYNQG